MDTALGKWGNSQAIRIPKELLDLAEIPEYGKVTVHAEGKRIVIERAKPRTLDDLFVGYRRSEPLEIVDWGDPVGREEL